MRVYLRFPTFVHAKEGNNIWARDFYFIHGPLSSYLSVVAPRDDVDGLIHVRELREAVDRARGVALMEDLDRGRAGGAKVNEHGLNL